jgi:DNA-binding beta-propeller fold protein YncE
LRSAGDNKEASNLDQRGKLTTETSPRCVPVLLCGYLFEMMKLFLILLIVTNSLQDIVHQTNDDSSSSSKIKSSSKSMKKNYNHTSRHLMEELQYIGNVVTLAGVTESSGSTNGLGTNAEFNLPVGVSISPDAVYALVADHQNSLIRQIIISTASVTTLAGLAGSTGSTNGLGTIARFHRPYDVFIFPDGVSALVADRDNHLIRRIIITTASVTTLAGLTGSAGSTNGLGTNARFSSPRGIAISPDGVYALVAGRVNHFIRQIIISTASVTTLAGLEGSFGSTNGVGTNARFNAPYGVSISPDGVYALVADRDNHLIRQIIISTASVTTLAGLEGSFGSTNGLGTNALLSNPCRVCISPDGIYALVADNDYIRQIIISTVFVTTLAGFPESAGSTNGLGTNALFRTPNGVTISPDGVYALVADYGNYLIRQIRITLQSPSIVPSTAPSSHPSSPLPTMFSFGVKIGDEGILSSGKSILVDYIRDLRRGETLQSLSLFPSFLLCSRNDDSHI